jgi:hypothetical protein
VPVAESVRDLEAAIVEARALGSRASRQLAQARERAAVRAGAHAVSPAHVVGPFFLTNPDEMFSLDRFHPSAALRPPEARAGRLTAA